MPHLVIIIDCIRAILDALDGGSSTGLVNDLREAFEASVAYVPANQGEADAIHEIHEGIHAYLCAGTTADVGIEPAIEGFLQSLEPYR